LTAREPSASVLNSVKVAIAPDQETPIRVDALVAKSIFPERIPNMVKQNNWRME